jgi:SAM-dependent methyltransferase
MKPSRVFEATVNTGISESEVARSWDENADSWAEQVRSGLDAYREHYNNPAFVEFIGDVRSKTVLDAGCGEGYNTRILARRGARMTGIDISARMIELAREEEERKPAGIRYEVASFTNLAPFADSTFDVEVSFMALMDGPDFPSAIRELYRVLKPGGTLAFSLTHPCFVTKGLSWIRDQSGNETGLTVAHYFDEQPWIERWKFAKVPESAQAAPFAVPRFDRTLAHYVNTVIDSGFILARIEEPRPSEQASSEHPWLKRWREHAPLFFYVRAQKPR